MSDVLAPLLTPLTRWRNPPALRRLESRFSSHYRNFPQTHADVLKHLWLPIPHSPIKELFSTHYRKLNLPQRCPDVPKYPELPFPHSPKERAVFKSLSAFASAPRRRANAPVNTYSALSSSNRLHWVQMPSKQRSIPAEIAVPCISRLNLHPSQTESCSRRNRCKNRYPILRRL